MSDIFISYAREDEPRAARLAGILRNKGYSVWWDRKIPPGRSFDEVIEEALEAAACVLVLWSHDSVGSRWVRNEAAAALERDCLIPIALDDATVPLAFRGIQSVQLAGWKGGVGHPQLQVLLQALGERITARDSDGGASGQVRRPEDAWRQAGYGKARWSGALRLRRPAVSDDLLGRMIVAEIVLVWLFFLVPPIYSRLLGSSGTYIGELILIFGAPTLATVTSLAVASYLRRFWKGLAIAASPLVLLYLDVIVASTVIPSYANDLANIGLLFLTPLLVTHIGLNARQKLRGPVRPDDHPARSGAVIARSGAYPG